MGLNNKELDELIYQFFDKNEYAENCILINADEQRVLILGKEAEKLYRKKELLHDDVIMQVKDEVLNGIKGRLTSEDANDICEALYDEKSEINKSLRKYIVSGRLIDVLPDQWENITASCLEIENYFSKYKDGLIHFLEEVNAICESIEIDTDKCFWVVAGQVTNSFLVRYYYSQNISFDPIIANPKLLFFPKGFRMEDYEEKTEKTNASLSNKAKADEPEDKSEVSISLYGDNQMHTIGLNVSEDKKAVIDYIGPIFVAYDDKIEVHLEDIVKKISLPYNVLPFDSDLVDIAAIIKENQLFLRIRRSQYPTRMYDILIK